MAKSNKRKQTGIVSKPVTPSPPRLSTPVKRTAATRSTASGGLTRKQAGPEGPRVYQTRTPPKEWTRPTKGRSKPQATRPSRPVVTPPKPPVVDPPVAVVRRGLVTASRLALAGQFAARSRPEKKAVRKAEPKPAKKTHRPERSALPRDEYKAKQYKGYDAVAGKPERLAKEKEVVRCKERPKDNRPRKGGGGGKRFIPWC